MEIAGAFPFGERADPHVAEEPPARAGLHADAEGAVGRVPAAPVGDVEMDLVRAAPARHAEDEGGAGDEFEGSDRGRFLIDLDDAQEAGDAAVRALAAGEDVVQAPGLGPGGGPAPALRDLHRAAHGDEVEAHGVPLIELQVPRPGRGLAECRATDVR